MHGLATCKRYFVVVYVVLNTEFGILKGTFISENMFLYTGTHKYIFPGAEVYYDPDDEYEETKSVSSDTDIDNIEVREDSQESFHSTHTNTSTHHPRQDGDFSPTETPHLSPEDVDSLLSAADNGQSQEPVEDWTSLNASLDTSLDCDHTLTDFEKDSAQHSEDSASHVNESTSNRCSSPSDL